MKKIAIATMIALSAITASAVEVGVTAARDYVGDGRTSYGVTVGESFGKFKATAGFSRAVAVINEQDRWSLVGSYDVTKFGPVTMSTNVGGAYLQNKIGDTGYALTVGVGASMPIANKVNLTVDLRRQFGQDRVQAFDGNTITAGLVYKF